MAIYGIIQKFYKGGKISANSLKKIFLTDEESETSGDFF